MDEVKPATSESQRADLQEASAALRRDLRKLLTDDSIVIDVGANRGQWAREVLEVIPALRMVCVEPQRGAYIELQEWAQRTGNIMSVNCAIDITDGVGQLNVTESDVGSSLLRPVAGQSSMWATPVGTEAVTTRRLDSLLAEQGIDRADLLKCDAQGYDLKVLESAGSLLDPSRIRAVLVELNFRSFYEGQGSFDEVVRYLTERGYRLAALYTHRDRDGWLWWADGLFIPA